MGKTFVSQNFTIPENKRMIYFDKEFSQRFSVTGVFNVEKGNSFALKVSLVLRKTN